MSRRVFITVLGTNNYAPCHYVGRKNGQVIKSDEICFVQEATLRLIEAKNWDSSDIGYVLLTNVSKMTNWLDNGHVDWKTKMPIESYGLKSILNAMNLPFNINPLDIPDGKNEDEIWTIFHDLFGNLEEGDDLYFDLTHGFRYLPMLVLVFGNYAKFLKNVKIAHISYGNYEARNIDSNEAPIVDLLSLSILQDWTSAAIAYLKNGNISMLCELGNETLAPILREPETRVQSAKDLKKLLQLMQEEIESRQLCRGIHIIESSNINSIKNLSDALKETMIKPFNPIFNKLKSSFKEFDIQSNPMNGFYAARWCLENGLFQQACTIFHENVVTTLCFDIDGFNWKIKSDRLIISKAFNIFANERPEEKWKLESETENDRVAEKNQIKKALESTLLAKLANSFVSMNDLRNDLNHAGYTPTYISSISNLKAKLRDRMCKIQELIEHHYNQSSDSLLKRDVNPLLINFSNHPSSTWEEKQLGEAAIYGKCIDLSFPQINATEDEIGISNLKKEFLSKIDKLIKKHSSESSTTVHIMGEQTLTYSIVAALQQSGIKCIASTSQRISQFTGKGSKEIIFKFEQFREYPDLFATMLK